MAKCLLFGHDDKLMKGAGQFADQDFLVCNDCGRTVCVGTGLAPVLPNPFVQLDSPRRVHTQKSPGDASGRTAPAPGAAKHSLGAG